MLSSFRPVQGLSLVLLALSIQACGSYKTAKVKEYRLAVLDNDSRYKAEFKTLIDSFNTKAGMHVLSYADNAEDANSAIIMTLGLKARDGKVGWGQWLSESKSESPLSKGPGQHPKRTVSYSMRLEFDAEYYTSRFGFSDATKQIEKEKLFFHEVGHGLEMDHVPNDTSDVMYEDIAGNKDFPRFFARVRAYMEAR